MNHAITAITLSFTLSVGAAAQRMGSTNSDAPTISQTMSSPDGLELVVEYTAITWADGRMMSVIGDRERGQRARARINGSAKGNPLGQLRSDQNLMVGETKVAAGLYSLYFTIAEDDLKWRLHAQSESDDTLQHHWILDLGEEKNHLSRLRMTLTAGETPDEASIEIGFGQMRTALEVAKGVGGNEEKDKEEEEEEELEEVEEEPADARPVR